MKAATAEARPGLEIRVRGEMLQDTGDPRVPSLGNPHLPLPRLLAQNWELGAHSLAQLSALISAEKTKNPIVWAYVLITNNDIITIVGPTAKQPQLEILHSSHLGTKALGTPTETDALAENIRSTRASELTQPKYYLADRQGNEPSLSQVMNTRGIYRQSAIHTAHFETYTERRFHLRINTLRHLVSTYYMPYMLF